MYRDKHIYNLIDRAKQTGCWVVSSDVIGQADDLIGYGCTGIVDPQGAIIAQVEQLQTGIISAEVS